MPMVIAAIRGGICSRQNNFGCTNELCQTKCGMARISIRRPMTILITLCLGLLGCAQKDSTITSAGCPSSTSLNDEIQKLVSDKSCTNAQDCSHKAYGYKACGGPSTFLIYSKKNVNEADLTQKVDNYNSVVEKCVKESGLSGECSVPNVPTLACNAGACKEQGFTP